MQKDARSDKEICRHEILESSTYLQANTPEGAGELESEILILRAVGDVDFGDH
jgi:hypothetical protein